MPHRRCWLSPGFPAAGLLLALVVAGAPAAGCRRSENGGPPVAKPSVTFNRERVAIGSPVTVTYKFEVAPEARLEEDYVVFVHVLDPEGEALWNDDHQPPVPTSQWKPGETIEYTRTIFVPNYPYIGEATVRIGLYKGQNRLVLDGNEATRREYVVARIQLLPQSENIFLTFKEGWHAAEVAPDNPASEWRWTRKRATISFRNPKSDVTFYLEYDARVDLFNPPQQVTLSFGGQPAGSFTADSRDKKLLTFPVSADQLGSGELAEGVIEVDRTFQPGAGDTRELGIRVYHAFVEQK